MRGDTPPPQNEEDTPTTYRDLFVTEALNKKHPSQVQVLHEELLDPNEFARFIEGGDGAPIAISYGCVPCTRDTLLVSLDACFLAAIAVSCGKAVLCVELDWSESADHTTLQTLLFNEKNVLFGLGLNRLILGLYLHYAIEAHVVDFFSLGADDLDTEPGVRAVVKRYPVLDQAVVSELFVNVDYDSSNLKLLNLCERAWMMRILYDHEEDLKVDLIDLPVMDIRCLTHEDRLTLAKIALNVDRLQAQQPEFTEHRVQGSANAEGIRLESQEFQTRIMKVEDDDVKQMKVHLQDGTTIEVELREVKGRWAAPDLPPDLATKLLTKNSVISATTLGRADGTTLDAQRSRCIYGLLQGSFQFGHNRALYRLFGERNARIDTENATPHPSNVMSYGYVASLNRSQQAAVRSVLGKRDDLQVALIHGPPGTGKTSVLVAQTEKLLELYPNSAVWLVAQSNVAVKNIAEKIMKTKIASGLWKIIVASDFHEWHTEFYTRMQEEKAILTAKQLYHKQKKQKIPETFGGIKVILCTLAMFTAPPLRNIDLHTLLPPHSLIVDEASQITMADFLPAMYMYGEHIQRLGFVGDPRQLAPYGSDETPGLQSIFEAVTERPCIADKKVLLNITYRLPMHLAQAISSHVYHHTLFDRFASEDDQPYTAVRFIDVDNSQEEREGTSFRNPAEADTCLEIARLLRGKEFKIITPYNGQTTMIDKKLKASKDFLKEDQEGKCNNVDSFQGNEADFIIISITRSGGLGFLENRRRTNVMLSRCKRGMFIVTNRKFLLEKARHTLVGSLAAEWSAGNKSSGWIKSDELDSLNIGEL